jgi:hypothetical protein
MVTFFFVVLSSMAMSSQALACSACGFGEDPTRWAFIFTTGLLTFIPLLMIGSVVFLIYKRSKKLVLEVPEVE